MVYLAAGALGACVLVCALMVVLVVLFMDRMAARDREYASERREWALERRELNQRIQAPEIATVEAISVENDGPGYVPIDNDVKYWETQVSGA